MTAHRLVRRLGLAALALAPAAFAIPEDAPEPEPVMAPTEPAARFGLNLYAPKDWNRTQPFLNVMKLSRPWISQDASTWDNGNPLSVNEHGYVTRLEPGQWAGTVMLTDVGASFPGGPYVFLYDGDGDFAWKGNGRLLDAEPGRQVVEVTPTDKGFVHLVITRVNPDDPPRNMRFVREAYETTFEEEVFAPEFLERWAGVNTLRFMDWMLINNSTLETWDDFPHPDDRTYWHGVPLTHILDLCNRMGANPWVCVPHLATDDTIRTFAAYIRDQLDPALTASIEFSNEVWNGMFAQTRFAQQRGKELGLATEPWKAGALYHARDCRRMFDLLDDVFAGEPRHRYRKVIASQASNHGFVKLVITTDEVYRHADVLAIAPYLTMNVPVEPSPWKPDMPTADTVATWDLDTVFAWLENHALPDCLTWMDQNQVLARDHNLDLACYEAGQHLVALGEANRNRSLVELLAEANRDPRMGDLYRRYLDHWTAIGGGVICLFNADQPYTTAGSWGLLEYLTQDPATAPKYQAVKRWVDSLP